LNAWRANDAFRVGRGRRGEDQAADHEDERRQAERDRSRDAERVVDRGADVAVGGGEERRRAEDALEALLAPAPSHARTLEGRLRDQDEPIRSAGSTRLKGRLARKDGAHTMQEKCR
jgi:hypothetical protein